MKRKCKIKRQIRALYGDMCLKCKKLMTFKHCKIDHVIPKSKGGPNHLLNFQPLCYRCNTAKADTTVDYRPIELVQLLNNFINLFGQISTDNCHRLRNEWIIANQEAAKLYWSKFNRV